MTMCNAITIRILYISQTPALVASFRPQAREGLAFSVLSAAAPGVHCGDDVTAWALATHSEHSLHPLPHCLTYTIPTYRRILL